MKILFYLLFVFIFFTASAQKNQKVLLENIWTIDSKIGLDSIFYGNQITLKNTWKKGFPDVESNLNFSRFRGNGLFYLSYDCCKETKTDEWSTKSPRSVIYGTWKLNKQNSSITINLLDKTCKSKKKYKCDIIDSFEFRIVQIGRNEILLEK